jgi:hypothetical protein
LIFAWFYSSTVSYMTLKRAMLALKVFYAYTNQRKLAEIEASKQKVKFFYNQVSHSLMFLSLRRYCDFFESVGRAMLLRVRLYASQSRTISIRKNSPPSVLLVQLRFPAAKVLSLHKQNIYVMFLLHTQKRRRLRFPLQHRSSLAAATAAAKVKFVINGKSFRYVRS